MHKMMMILTFFYLGSLYLQALVSSFHLGSFSFYLKT